MVENTDVTLECVAAGGVPSPRLSWHRESTDEPEDFPDTGENSLGLVYTGDRGHHGDQLVCRADQTGLVTRAVVTDAKINLDILCKIFSNFKNLLYVDGARSNTKRCLLGTPWMRIVIKWPSVVLSGVRAIEDKPALISKVDWGIEKEHFSVI